EGDADAGAVADGARADAQPLPEADTDLTRVQRQGDLDRRRQCRGGRLAQGGGQRERGAGQVGPQLQARGVAGPALGHGDFEAPARAAIDVWLQPGQRLGTVQQLVDAELRLDRGLEQVATRLYVSVAGA